jgi:hypothetical protein
MKRFGFVDFTLGSGSAERVSRPDEMSRRYGPVSDAATAAQYGYHLTPWQRLPDAAKPSTRPTTPAFSSAETLVLTGSSGGPASRVPTTGTAAGTYGGQEIPAGGCYGEANRALKVDPRLDVQLPQSLGLAAYAQSRSDARVKALVSEWSQCMKQRGYDLTDPVNAADAFSLEGPTTTAEIRQAKADVSCKVQVGLVATWYAVESAYDKKLIEQNQEQLTAIRRMLDNELRSAAEMLHQAVLK